MWKLGNRTLKFCLKIMRPCSSISGDTEKSEPDTFILDSHRPFFCSDVQWNLGFFHEGLYFFWLSRRCKKVCLQQDEFFHQKIMKVFLEDPKEFWNSLCGIISGHILNASLICLSTHLTYISAPSN